MYISPLNLWITCYDGHEYIFCRLFLLLHYMLTFSCVKQFLWTFISLLFSCFFAISFPYKLIVYHVMFAKLRIKYVEDFYTTLFSFEWILIRLDRTYFHSICPYWIIEKCIIVYMHWSSWTSFHLCLWTSYCISQQH